MMFGNPQVFAVQVDVEDDSRWFSGGLLYWIAGSRFGDPMASVYLGDAAGELAPIVKDGGRRFDEGLTVLTDAEAFALLYDHLYGPELEIIDMAARFEVSLKAPSFADCICFAVQIDEDCCRLLLGSHDAGFQRSEPCPIVALEDALFDAYMYLNNYPLTGDAVG